MCYDSLAVETPVAHHDVKPRRYSQISFLRRVCYSLGAALLLSGCADLPRDQEGWTAKIQVSKVLVVGVSREQEKPAPLEEQEKQLVEKIAARLGAKVQWRPGNAHTLLQELGERELPLVAATIPASSPFAQSVGLSQPYKKKGPKDEDYCLAVAPGENRLLLLVDQVIAEERKRQEGGA